MYISGIWRLTSIIIAFLVSVSSLLGIFYPETYSQETPNWVMQAIGQDIGNLLAVPVLLASTFLLGKNSFRAFFVWTGVHLYFIYAFLVYAFFIHFNFLFLVYVAVLGLSSYTVIGGLAEQKLSYKLNAVSGKQIKISGLVLIVTGMLFEVLWLSEIIPALFSGRPPASIIAAGLWVNPIQVIDLALVLPGMILTGVLLLKKRLFGYLFTAPWLTFSVLMGSSIVVTLLMDFKGGNSEAVVPLTMVGSIVTVSLSALYLYLRPHK